MDAALLQKYNRAVELRDKIWTECSLQGKMDAQLLFDHLQAVYIGLTDQDFIDYLATVHGYKGEPSEVDIR